MQILPTVIRRIEKSVYDTGINVALENAEASSRYKKMVGKLRSSLLYQIELVAKPKHIESLLLFTKGVNESLITGISTVLSKDSLSDLVKFGDFLHWAGGEGGQAALDKMGIQGTFVLKNPELLKYFDDYSNLIIDTVDETTKKWIAARIQYGKDKLLTPQEIVNLLTDEGKGISELRAKRIAITETAHAMTTVELEAARRYGIRDTIWRTSRDERTCPICLGLDGVQIPIGKLYPGGVQGPPAHILCRCFLEEVIPNNWEIPTDIGLGE
jgi:SPP1 gp7 family putative phage head morphogenesis protein